MLCKSQDRFQPIINGSVTRAVARRRKLVWLLTVLQHFTSICCVAWRDVHGNVTRIRGDSISGWRHYLQFSANNDETRQG